MPKSSRHKSHRHSKHSSKDAREYSESDEDTKKRELSKGEGSARVSRNLVSGEKRKDPPGHSNGDVTDEYAGLKRREKEKGDVSDRWIGGGGVERGMKGETSRADGEKTLKSKSGGESKSKSSRVYDSVSEEKEESKVESKRKHEKEYVRKEAQMGKDSKESSKDKIKVVEKEYVRKEAQMGKDSKELKDKIKVVEKEKERKVKESVHEVEDEVVDIGDAIIPAVVFGEEQRGKHGKEINVWPVQDERVPDSEKDIEKRRRKRDGSYEKDKYQDDVKGSGDRRVSSRGERAKDGKYKDGSHGDKHLENVDREARYKDEKYAEDVDKERRYRDAKYRESIDKVKYREDVDRDKKTKDDKYREGGDRDTKYRDAKYREDADKDYRRRVDKYHEDGNRDDRQRDDWYFEDYNRDSRIREEKNWEDAGRDGKRREEKQRDDIIKDKRPRDDRLIRDGTNDNFDPKRSRDESEVAEFRHKRLTHRDGSPNFDDRSTRYKDDRGKRRASDKEEYDDVRVRSNKEQYLDIEKKSTSARVEPVGNRGRSSLRDADMVISSNHVRRGDSPSYRLLKQEESRFRENMHGGRERRDVTPGKDNAGFSGVTEKVSCPNEKSFPKDNRQGDDASTERRPKEDALIPSFQMVDKSPLSANNDRRNFRRADVRRSLDIEDSEQRTGGSNEIKDYYGRDNRRNRELPVENLPRDENSQPDAEISKPSHFNNNNRSHLPPTPFRGGPDRPFDDDNRNKQNRRRRMDPNMGRTQGNAWRGLPNWPSPVANGFVPFQHGPPLGFHPVMPQFPAPIFGVRPSMEMNQSGVPFHVHDGDRFPGHGRPLGWDGNNPIFGDDPHIYGRLDWDHNRGLNSGRGWETSRDIWKGQNTGVSAELSAVTKKDDFSAHGGCEDWTGKSVLPAQTDNKQPNVQAESVDIDQLSDVVERDTAEAPKAIAEDMSDSNIRDDAYFSRAYLSMLDISEDLSQYELFSQYTNLVGMDQNANPEEDDSKLMIMEEDIDALGKDSKKTSNASLFCTMNDAIFQRAMSLYKKLKDEVMTIGQDRVPSPTVGKTESALPSDHMEAASDDDQSPMEVIPTLWQKEAEVTVTDSSKVKMEANLLTDGEVKSEPIAPLKEVKMEIADNHVEDICLSVKEVITDSIDDNSNEGQNFKDGKFVPLPFSGASAESGIEGVIESGSINLSRIHQSPESTH